MASIRLDPRDFQRATTRAFQQEQREGAREVLNRAKLLTPVDTGRLRSSIKMRIVGGRAEIYTDVSYAEAVHNGARPHIIRPRRRQALRFVAGGRVVFARQVNHPGTRARPFLVRALREVARRRGWVFTNEGV